MSLTPYQIIQQVKDDYNLVGDHFAQTRRKKIQAELLPFIRRVKSGMRVLDVGCGSGRLLSELNHKKIDYIGVDFSQKLIDHAKDQYPERKFLLRDLTSEEGWRRLGQFDAVFCLGMLHHIPDKKTQHEVLKQIYLHTQPQGFLVLSVWNLWQTRVLKYHLRQIIKKINYRDLSFVWIPYSASDGVRPVKTIQRFCKAFFAGEIISLIKQVGFQVETFYYASQGKTHLSIFKGNNFCVLGYKGI